jgi:FKBP-type peptidyl-prolyl cis-trans isomerase
LSIIKYFISLRPLKRQKQTKKMKKQIFTIGMTAMIAVALLPSCKRGGNWQTDEKTGVQYLMLKHDEKGEKPVIGDMAYVQLYGKSSKDSVLWDSRKMSRDTTGALPIQLKHSFRGCLEDGITLMAVGDSARFCLSTDSLYMKRFGMKAVPPYEIAGAHDTLNIKLIRFLTEAQMKQEQEEMFKKRQADMEQAKMSEPGRIAKYLEDNHYNVKPTADSLFILSRSGGKGKPVKDGDSVEVSYTGYLLDGTVFDKSDRGPSSKTFKLAYGPDAHIIKAWIKTLGTMKEGEKVKMLSPSWMAYGNRQPSPVITPYSPLVFEIEVIRAWK